MSDKAEQITREICEAFRTQPIVRHDLGPHQINEMTVIWKDKGVQASWYSSGSFRSLRIDGVGSLPVSTEKAERIVKAAMSRARTLADEILEKL